MVSFLYRMPSGMPGAVNRAEHATVEPGLLLVSSPPLTFGSPVVVDASTGRYRAFAANDAATVVAGLIVRPFPGSSITTTTDGLGPVAPDPARPQNILKRGYATVLLSGLAAAAKNGRVYLRTTGLNSTNLLGAFQAATGYTGAGAANGGNTGNPTIGAITTGISAQVGVYHATFSSATAYTVTDPASATIGTGVLGTVYSNPTNEISFTLTVGSTPAVSGDSFAITLTAATLLGPANWFFMGPADAQGNIEIALNL